MWSFIVHCITKFLFHFYIMYSLLKDNILIEEPYVDHNWYSIVEPYVLLCTLLERFQYTEIRIFYKVLFNSWVQGVSLQLCHIRCRILKAYINCHFSVTLFPLIVLTFQLETTCSPVLRSVFRGSFNSRRQFKVIQRGRWWFLFLIFQIYVYLLMKK